MWVRVGVGVGVGASGSEYTLRERRGTCSRRPRRDRDGADAQEYPEGAWDRAHSTYSPTQVRRARPGIRSDRALQPQASVGASAGHTRSYRMHTLAPSPLCPPALPASTAPPGHEFDALSPHEQSAAAERLAVLSRVEPLHKLRLVELLRQRVGMVLGIPMKEGGQVCVGRSGR